MSLLLMCSIGRSLYVGENSLFHSNVKCGFRDTQHCEVLRVCDTESEIAMLDDFEIIKLLQSVIHH